METETLTHGSVESTAYEEVVWPVYYVVSENVDHEDFTPAYYRVEGPNGPVTYMNPSSEEPIPTTMYSLTMDLLTFDCRTCRKEDTPYNFQESNW